MSRLSRLYPRVWRERYLAEFDDLLVDRPPTVGDQIDIVRGAFDAWIHPQLLARPPRQEVSGAGARRFATAAAILGGGLWIAGGLAMNSTHVSPTLGYKDSGSTVILLIAGAVLTALAAVALATSATRGSRAATLTAVAMLVGAVLIATPWPLLIYGFFGYALATVAFGVMLVRAENRPLAGLLSVAALILPTMNTEDERALLTIPFGLAWIAVGALAVRRAPAATAA